MKVCVYVEWERLAKKFGDTGIGNAARNQRLALERNNIEVVSDPNDDYDILDLNPMVFLTAWSTVRKAQKDGKKVVVHVHTTPENFRNSFWFSNLVAPIVDRRMKSLFQSADALVCLTEHVKKDVAAMGVKTPAYVVSNCANVGKYSNGDREIYRKKYGLNGVVPFSVGLVIPRKGIATFTAVAAKFPQNRFVWYGSIGKGLLTSMEARKVVREAPTNVTFTGYVDDIAAAYASGDIFLFPSHNELFSMVILEALAAGKPMILRDLPIYDWIKGGKECLKARNDKEFCEQLQRLMDDSKLRSALVSNGNRLLEKYCPENVGKRLKSIYEDVLRK